jgi:hypothetical protein
MKYQETYLGSRSEFSEFVKKTIPDLFNGKLVVEGKNVVVPRDTELDYKIKYDEDEQGGCISLKVTWEKEGHVEIDLDD